MNEEAILDLWNEGMIPSTIALKLGIPLDWVLFIIFPKAIGYADDGKDKVRYAVAEEQSLTT